MSPTSTQATYGAASGSVSSSSMSAPTTAKIQKASPSDVMFGQPPGSDENVQPLESLSSDSSPNNRNSSVTRSRPSSRVGSLNSSRKSISARSPLISNGQSVSAVGDSFPAPPKSASSSSSFSSSEPPSRIVSPNQHQSRLQHQSSQSFAQASGSLGASASASASVPASASAPSASAATDPTKRSSLLAGDVTNGIKVLPYLLDNADPEDITVLVADMLSRLMTHNDTLPLHPSALTRFHSRAAPGISIHAYLRRIARYTSLDKACMLILLVYIDRVCERMKGFTVCGLTVHRFVCAAVVCASKALCDAFSTNEHYAKVGGISLVELNMLEKEFLGIIDWRLTCSGALLQHYYVSLVSSHSSYTLADSPLATPDELEGEEEAYADPLDDVAMATENSRADDARQSNGHSGAGSTNGHGSSPFSQQQQQQQQRGRPAPPPYIDRSAQQRVGTDVDVDASANANANVVDVGEEGDGSPAAAGGMDVDSMGGGVRDVGSRKRRASTFAHHHPPSARQG